MNVELPPPSSCFVCSNKSMKFCNTSSGGTGSCTAAVKDLACKILAQHNSHQISLWDQHPSGVHDNAYALNNIRDTCD
ncbi:hypothetical protein CHS0354_042465 [Potamilus streckersoni]|uniref:Uncharacterized protein n=1 Tax=Potamilus streckersoni TaxID=2493646 RepID=A0AAE0S999_9BIVA|nr:hypothetical protein CHS0354_042465 [Potamilus streckersoni]